MQHQGIVKKAVYGVRLTYNAVENGMWIFQIKDIAY